MEQSDTGQARSPLFELTCFIGQPGPNPTNEVYCDANFSSVTGILKELLDCNTIRLHSLTAWYFFCKIQQRCRQFMKVSIAYSPVTVLWISPDLAFRLKRCLTMSHSLSLSFFLCISLGHLPLLLENYTAISNAEVALVASCH